MKLHKIVTVIIVVTVVLATPFVIENLLKWRDYKFLSEQFIPVFNDVNKQLESVFAYKDAFYHSSSDGMFEYSLEYLDEDSNFLDKSIEFCNMFCTSVMSGEYDTVRLKNGDYVIRIKSSSLYLNCWYSMYSNSLTASLTVSTNATNNYAIFETLKGIRRLTVVTKDFTEEQKEYTKSFQDKCSFELVLSDKIPW